MDGLFAAALNSPPTATPRALEDGTEVFLALDRDEPWAAGFSVTVSEGTVTEDVHYAELEYDRWRSVGSAGASTGPFETPWVPELPAGVALSFMRGGLDVEDADGNDFDLCAIGGFAIPGVSWIQAQRTGALREVHPIGPLMAFALVIVGRGPTTITAFDADGNVLGEPNVLVP